MWSYGIELWGSAKPWNIKRSQSLLSIILRKFTHRPFYVSNFTLHNDLDVVFVRNLAIGAYSRFRSKLKCRQSPTLRTGSAG